jgi:crotonobetainyl-CoA:carnitine CoA-transferase CaiB-like acyl-CoA transferase
MRQAEIFKDLLVIELASVLAGPAVGMFFAELGARVIKIENKTTGGDVTRRWKVPGETEESHFSAYYQQVNFGKEIQLLDLKQQEAQVVVHDLVRKADIVISNFLPEKAKQMRMDESTLRALNPQLIFAHLSAFGEDQTRPAFDVVLQAETGFLFMTGAPDSPPAKMPVALIDLLAAHQLKEGILLALIYRMQQQKGCSVKTSLIEAAIASLANQANNWLVAGHIPQRMGSQHPNIAPYGDIFHTKDQKSLVLAVGTERHFVRLCDVLKRNTLPEDPRFETNAQRVRHRGDLYPLLQKAIQHFDRSDLLARLETAGVPAGAIRTMPEVFELPQARALVGHYSLPDGSQGTYLRSAVFQITT